MKNSSKLFSALLLLIGLAYILSPLASFAKDKHKELEYEYEHEDEYEDDDHYEYSAPQPTLEAAPIQQTVSALDQTQRQLAEQYAGLEARRQQLEQRRAQQQQLAEQFANVEKQLSEQRIALEVKAQQLAQRRDQQEAATKQLEQEERQLNNKKQSPISNAIKTGARKVAAVFTGSDSNTAVTSAPQNTSNVIAVKDENRNGISDILEGFLRIARR